MDILQQYIHKSRYARWIPDEQRRETWEETVRRYMEFFVRRIDPDTINYDVLREIEKSVLNLDVMPSMRCLMTAGPALDRDNVAGYNCAYLPVDNPRAFDETMYILMCGTGVGFSVERQYVNKLPEVSEEHHETDSTIVVSDSKIGWASAFRELISLLYSGKIPTIDTSRIRPAGAPLRTFGGRASGPEPFRDLCSFTIDMFTAAQGRRLNDLECHDLMCKIGAIVVVGGVRRSALISLSNPTSDRMCRAKYGNWWDTEPQRALANNSAVYTDKPDYEFFLKEAMSLHESKSGERGFFSRPASKKQAIKSGRRDAEHEFGTNPCSEIILRPNQFCNLSEVVVRPDDTFDVLKHKVRAATILGTMQSTLTEFRYLRKIWTDNTAEERLLGVSLTGIMDHPFLNGTGGNLWEHEKGKFISLPLLLQQLKEVAIETNKHYAELLGIPCSTAITCVKPSGTVSQLVNSASGIHPRFSNFYIRRVRADNKDPLAQFMQANNFPFEVDNNSNSVLVFSFPIKAPQNTVTVSETGAMEQLRLWKIYQDNWCEHKPSITVYYNNNNFMEVMQWLFNNFNDVSGISLLPQLDHNYKQAPYEEITEEQYQELISKFPPEIDWDALSKFESTDMTTGSQEYACVGNSCEL